MAIPCRHWAARGTAGFTLVEIALVTVFLLVAVGGLSSAVLSSMQLSRATEESARADDALRELASRMQVTTFAEIFSSYNADPDDDPDGPGSAPGDAFDVTGLTPRSSDPDGRVGRIVFPSEPTGVGLGQALREDVLDPRLGMDGFRDLNGDGLTDALDHSGDYIVLPVRLIVEWSGASGPRTLELDLCLVP